MTQEQQHWMSIAIQEAQEAAAAGEIPVGAVIVRDGTLLSRAHNLRQTLHDPTAHAEILCMRQAALRLGDWHLSGCTLYVTLEPCPMCAGAMVMSQLSHCVFGAYDARQGCCGSVYDLPADPALGACTRWQGGILQEDCAALMRDFFAAHRKA